MLAAIKPLGRLHESLKGIKQVINIYPKQKGQGNKKERKTRTLTKMDEIQEKLFDLFEMNDYIDNQLLKSNLIREVSGEIQGGGGRTALLCYRRG